MKEKTDSQPITATGIIGPVDWDDDGNIIEISVSLPGEIEYIIMNNKKGKKLLRHLRKEVKVKGVLYTDKGGRKMINIMDFEINRPEDE